MGHYDIDPTMIGGAITAIFAALIAVWKVFKPKTPPAE